MTKETLCKECGKDAEYNWEGNPLCKKHYYEYFARYQHNAFIDGVNYHLRMMSSLDDLIGRKRELICKNCGNIVELKKATYENLHSCCDNSNYSYV